MSKGFWGVAISAALAANILASQARGGQQTAFVFDSTGKTVGALINLSSTVSDSISYGSVVAVQLKPPISELVQMSVATEGIGAVGGEFYATADCSGPPYLKSDLLKSAHREISQQDMIILADAQATPVQVMTYRDAASSPCTSLPNRTNALPVQRFDARQLGFSPPFHVELR